MAPLKTSFLFISSLKDPAGVLMAEYIRELYSFEELHNNLFKCLEEDWVLAYIEDDIIYSDNIENKLNIQPETIIFLSRHSSKSEFPTLSTHVTGNPTKDALYGGKAYSLAPSHPILMKSVLYYMYTFVKERNLKYNVTLEVTHHGPTEIFTPSFFVEVGSTIRQWKDKKAIETVVDAVVSAIKNPLKGIPTVGFGGPHYAPIFTRYSLEDKYAFGHILSKYVLNDTPDNVILDAFKKTENSKTAVFNWKGVYSSIRRNSLYKKLIDWGIDVIRV